MKYSVDQEKYNGKNGKDFKVQFHISLLNVKIPTLEQAVEKCHNIVTPLLPYPNYGTWNYYWISTWVMDSRYAEVQIGKNNRGENTALISYMNASYDYLYIVPYLKIVR